MNEMDLRVIKTKQSLEKALFDLLKHKPLEQITVTELCEQSGITRKTFYLHYENVPNYFEEFIAQLLDQLEESLQKTTNLHFQSDQQLEPQMIYVFEHVYKNREVYQFIFNSNSHFVYYEMFFKRIKSLFKNSIEMVEGSRKDDSGDFEFVVAYHTNAILGVIYEWYLGGFEKSVDEMNHLLLKIIK
ncbi:MULTISPECIES: TetR-like C-terminal domain-containing protein [Bacillaceae]|uniref:TetR family transcriptional regulator C-terminal domain-containing protein n=1 Tax=Evansella alkalicola TaxID=745819 RepID=A0ABS6K182_9BACI|nr:MULTISPECIES: TetR-like C-terminal domain-containing protein [Bacillaceae]MBU9723207.1 TetR family transcriptional regulator C-terminal domain-containing protein [Bacillus alkalicola]